MIKKEVLGKLIIGIAITLAIASIPLFISGTERITDKLILFTPAYVGGRNIAQYPLQGHSLAISLLFIGLSIVGLVTLKDSKRFFKSVIYPILISTILGITLGAYFAVIYPTNSIHYAFELYFNWNLFFMILGLGVFISLITLGTNLLKK